MSLLRESGRSLPNPMGVRLACSPRHPSLPRQTLAFPTIEWPLGQQVHWFPDSRSV